MTDERDPKLTQRYRDLGAEEPARALDEAILAASRRAVGARPQAENAPARPARRGWLAPVAAAAVLVLAVAVTIHVERERPAEVAVAPQSAPSERPAEAPPAKTDEQRALEAPASRPAAEPPASRAPATPQARALAKASAPEADLARIVELRERGQHEEADRLLAEFRRRYPDYRIAEEMLKKVER